MSGFNKLLLAASICCGMGSHQAMAEIDCSNLPTWEGATIYTGGKEVQHNGSAYRAKWWTRAQPPQTNSSSYQVWALQGQCTGSAATDTATASTPDAIIDSNPEPVANTVTTPSVSAPEPHHGLDHCTDFDDNTFYLEGDLVAHEGNYYECLSASFCSFRQGTLNPGTAFGSQYAWQQVDLNTFTQACPDYIPPEPVIVTPSDGTGVGQRDPNFPAHAITGVWNPRRACSGRLNEVPADLDIVTVAAGVTTHSATVNGATTTNNTDGVILDLFAGNEDCPALSPSDLQQDIRSLQAQGKVVLLSVTGDSRSLDNAAHEALFISTTNTLLDQYGFDGLDIAFTRTGIQFGDSQPEYDDRRERLTRAIRSIHDNRSSDIFLTLTPHLRNIHGGLTSLSNSSGSQISLVEDLRDILDLVQVNLYTRDGLVTPENIRYPGGLSELSTAYLVDAMRMLVNGFFLADGSSFNGLRPDQLSLNVPASRIFTLDGISGGSSFAAQVDALRCIAEGGTRSRCGGGFENVISTDIVTSAVSCLTAGTQCDEVGSGEFYPAFNGVTITTINDDQLSQNRLLNAVRPQIDSLQ